MDGIKKEEPKKVQKKKEPTKTYISKRNCFIGQKKKPIKVGDKLSLTKEQAEAYLKNNII